MNDSILEITSQQIKWPILCIKDKKYFVFNSAQKIVQTSRELLHSGIFKGVNIIDSNGNQFEIASAIELKPSNIFGGISLLKKGHQIIAKIVLKKIGQITLTQLTEIASMEAQRNTLIQEKFAILGNEPTYENIIGVFE